MGVGRELADKVKQVTAFNLVGTVQFEGFESLVCVFLVINTLSSQIAFLPLLDTLKEQ